MEFFDRPENTTGALASRLSTYPTNLEELLGFNLGLIVIQLVNIVSSSVLALIVGWKLGLVVVLGAMPVVVFFGWLRIRLQGKMDELNGERFSESAGLAAEAVSAIRTISSLTLERHILGQYQEKLKGISIQSTKSYLWMMFWYSLTQSVSFLAMALGFWYVDKLYSKDKTDLLRYGGTLIARGEYSTTQFFIVFIAVIFSGEAVSIKISCTAASTKLTFYDPGSPILSIQYRYQQSTRCWKLSPVVSHAEASHTRRN